MKILFIVSFALFIISTQSIIGLLGGIIGAKIGLIKGAVGLVKNVLSGGGGYYAQPVYGGNGELEEMQDQAHPHPAVALQQ